VIGLSPANEVTITAPPAASDQPAAGVIEAGLRQLGPAGGIIRLTKGTYVVDAFNVIPSGVNVTFEDITVKIGYPGLFLKTLPGTSKVTFSGKLSLTGSGSASAAIGIFGSTGVELNLEAAVDSLGQGRPFVLFDQCKNVGIRGKLSSRDSRLVAATDSSNVEVSGVDAGPYTVDPRDGIVRILTTGKHDPVSGIYLHDIKIDGGGVLGTSGMIGVNPVVAGTRDVRIERCDVRNSVGMVDGVDVNRSVGVSVSDIYAESVNVGVAVVASSAKVSKIEGHRCRAQAFEYGDPKYQYDSISGLEGDGIIARDCGSGWGGIYAAGVGVYLTPGTTTSNVLLRNIDSMDTDGRSQRFGFGMSRGVSNVKIVGGRLGGYAGKVLNQSDPKELSIEDVN
jgi:hypothetical protein